MSGYKIASEATIGSLVLLSALSYDGGIKTD